MKAKLPNGVSVEGTTREVAEILKKLNVKGTDALYLSASKGALLIEDMHAVHIRNALLTEYREWVNTTLKNAADVNLFLSQLSYGPSTPLMRGFITELSRRNADGDVKWG